MDIALEARELCYRFPDGKGVQDITFQVQRREIYTLYGGHNAGKSVLLQVIAGAIMPQSGMLQLFENVECGQERCRIGYVPQIPVTIGKMTPAEMLRYFSFSFGVEEHHIADLLHLDLKDKKPVCRLPLSAQRLVNLGAALLGNPDLVIIDDPFSGLDQEECEHLLSILSFLHENNHITFLLAGQDFSLLSRISSKYGVLENGRLAGEFTEEELKEICTRCIKLRTPQLDKAIPVLRDNFPDYEVLSDDLVRLFGCGEHSGRVNSLLVNAGIEVSEIWLAGMEPADYLIKLTGGSRNRDSSIAK